MKYRFPKPGNFDEFPGLDLLIGAALAAASRGKHYRGNVVLEDEGNQKKIYVELIYKDGVPVALELGQELPTSFSHKVQTQLDETGIKARCEQVWGKIGLVAYRPSFRERFCDLFRRLFA